MANATRPEVVAERDLSLGDTEVTNRLLILNLIRNGVKQREIADAIGMHESTLSRLFPKGLLQKVGRMRSQFVGAE